MLTKGGNGGAASQWGWERTKPGAPETVWGAAELPRVML